MSKTLKNWKEFFFLSLLSLHHGMRWTRNRKFFPTIFFSFLFFFPAVALVTPPLSVLSFAIFIYYLLEKKKEERERGDEGEEGGVLSAGGVYVDDDDGKESKWLIWNEGRLCMWHNSLVSKYTCVCVCAFDIIIPSIFISPLLSFFYGE